MIFIVMVILLIRLAQSLKAEPVFFYSLISVLCALCLLDMNEYIAGITNNVNISENKIPPTTTMPNGTRLVAAAPKLMAIGKAPSDVAMRLLHLVCAYAGLFNDLGPFPRFGE